MHPVPFTTEDGNLICSLDVGLPHLDAVFVNDEKRYKIVSVSKLGTEEEPEYAAVVREVQEEQK